MSQWLFSTQRDLITWHSWKECRNALADPRDVEKHHLPGYCFCLGGFQGEFATKSSMVHEASSKLQEVVYDQASQLKNHGSNLQDKYIYIYIIIYIYYILFQVVAEDDIFWIFLPLKVDDEGEP